MKVVARWNCLKAQPFYVKIINYLRNPSGKLTYEKMKVIARRNCLKAQPFFDKVFRAGGIKYCVTAYAKEELLRALNLSERTDA